MNALITVDVGHLLGNDHTAFFSLISKYKEVFEEFQLLLKEGKFPITLSLTESNSILSVKGIANILEQRYENVLILGIGGSALGIKAILQFIKGPFYNLEGNHKPRVFVLDNLSAALVHKLHEILDFKKTAIVYISKSGSTPETAANFVHFFGEYKKAGGNLKDIVIICDSGDNGINRIAKGLGCHLLHIPRDLPGRYSVLSSVGFLPSEIIGVDSNQLLEGARIVHRSIIDNSPSENGLFALGASLFDLGISGKPIHILFNYDNLLSEFGFWFMQLWAESLGKKLSLTGEVINAGTTPLACIGATDQHSLLQLFKEGPDDKVFGFVIVRDTEDVLIQNGFPSEIEYNYFTGRTIHEQLSIEQLATEISLVRAGRPCYRLTLKDVSATTLGALFYLFEALVVFVAKLCNVNPFDQPGVEDGKNITYALMGRKDYDSERSKYEKEISDHDRKRRVFQIS